MTAAPVAGVFRSKRAESQTKQMLELAGNRLKDLRDRDIDVYVYVLHMQTINTNPI